MDFWRRSARISRRDKIRNGVIKQKMNGQNSIIDFIKNEQLKWYGHVKRMTEDRFPRKVLEWVPPGRRRGRPRITWIDGVLSCMREKGLKVVSCDYIQMVCSKQGLMLGLSNGANELLGCLKKPFSFRMLVVQSFDTSVFISGLEDTSTECC